MNDDFLRKISGITSAYNKVKSINDMSNSSLAAMSGVNAFMDKNMYNVINSNPVLSSKSGVDALLKNIYVEPEKFNPIMAAFGNVSQMMKYYERETPYNPLHTSVVEFMRNFSNENTINSLAGVSKMTSTLLNNINFNTFNWRENYPNMFLGESMLYEPSKQYAKFNENIKRLIDLSVLQEDSTLIDGSTVSLNLDNNQTEIFDPVIKEIYEITNQAFEKLNDVNNDSLKILNKLLSRLSKFVNHQYTVALVTGIVLILVNYYFSQLMEVGNKVNPNKINIEKLISESEIGLKQRPIKKHKDFVKIPIGSEISIIEKYKLWAKITYINSKGIPQVGYCRIEDLKKVAN